MARIDGLKRAFCTALNTKSKRTFSTAPDGHPPEIAARIMARFPPVALGFAYGSGISAQSGSNAKDNMIDLVFAVEDSASWHRENLNRHPGDYSLLRLGGPSFLANVQDTGGAHMYYNTLVPFEDRLIKYGVMSVERLREDLLDWSTLYVAGRLHKPVLMLADASAELHGAYHSNLAHAVAVALLLLPAQFEKKDLYTMVAGISYMGDFRMKFGENPHKVANIVKGNPDGFEATYKDVLAGLAHLYMEDSKCEQDTCPATRQMQLQGLPLGVRSRLLQRALPQATAPTSDQMQEAWRQLSTHKDLPLFMRQAVAEIVQGSARTQALKGVMTAGLVKTVQYSGEKLKKMLKGHRKGA